MAERRMFAKTIIDSDAFLDMPLSTQALYFHLSMRADDEGFINNARKIQRTINASDDDLKLLISKMFVIPFESGIVVIKHWKLHNYIRGDRIKNTVYQEEKDLLMVKENGSYTLCQADVSQLSDKCQHRLGKVRLDKDSIGKDRLELEDIMSEKYDCQSAIDYLNTKYNKRYKLTKVYKQHIEARFKEGFTLDDFKTVIDNMIIKWGNDNKMAQYIRPETLFNTKFQSYLNVEITNVDTGKLSNAGELMRKRLENLKLGGDNVK